MPKADVYPGSLRRIAAPTTSKPAGSNYVEAARARGQTGGAAGPGNRAPGNIAPDGGAGRREGTAEIESLKSQVQEHETLRSQWKSAEHELQGQKLAASGEAAQLTAKLSLLNEELETVSTRSASVRRTLSRQRDRWRTAAAVGGAIALSFLCVAWSQMKRPTETQVSVDSALNPRPVGDVAAGAVSSLDPGAAFTIGLDRLDSALAAVPGGNQGNALRKASMAGSGCMLVWTDNGPSVVFGKGPLRGNSLANTLANCAEAVVRVR